MKVGLLGFLVLTLGMPVMLYGTGGSVQQKSPPAPEVTRISKIVIDPGHGGRDPGTTFGKIYEKDIVLSVGLKLGKLITRNFPDVEVIYTRTEDVFVDVAERGNMANRAGADLFLSLHVNSTDKGNSINGTSTFVMGENKSGQNFDEIKRENSVIVYEKDYATKYAGYDPNSPESHIVFSLMQFAYQGQSMEFAETVQKHLAKDLPMRDRGTFQHDRVLVLWKPAMPRALVEIGFLTNPKDRQYINSDKGQNAIAKSLFNAFSEYKSKVEGRTNMVQLRSESSGGVPEPVAVVKPQTTGAAEVAANNSAGYRSDEVAVNDKAAVEFKGEYTQPRAKTTLPDIAGHFRAEAQQEKAALERQIEKDVMEAASSVAGENTSGEVKPRRELQANKPVTQPKAPTTYDPVKAATPGNRQSLTQNQSRQVTPTGNTERKKTHHLKTQQTTTTPAPAGQIRYYVQISALNRSKSTDSPDFKSYRGRVTEIRSAGGMYKYMVGGVGTYSEAQQLLRQAQREFRDAFIVAFEGNTQIKPDEARRKTGR